MRSPAVSYGVNTTSEKLFYGVPTENFMKSQHIYAPIIVAEIDKTYYQKLRKEWTFVFETSLFKRKVERLFHILDEDGKKT